MTSRLPWTRSRTNDRGYLGHRGSSHGTGGPVGPPFFHWAVRWNPGRTGGLILDNRRDWVQLGQGR